MPTCAEVLARTLRDAGVTRLYGLPGGEVLEFIEAARRADLPFLLTRQEATASFMADVTGQITRRPGVSVATLGPGAVNMTLGVANAYLDRSPVIAITAAHSLAAAPFATHQNLDLNALYRPITKLALTLDGVNTEAAVRRAIRTALAPRMGPVHIALPSDVARAADRVVDGEDAPIEMPLTGPASADAVERAAREVAGARRPVVILGVDLDPIRDRQAVRGFVERLQAPVFVTPKAKGMLPEDHRLFHAVCAGVAGDAAVVDFFRRADLLIGIGFDPVESDKLWHQSMRLVSIAPVTIAAGSYRPHAEAVGRVSDTLEAIAARNPGPFEWEAADRERLLQDLAAALRPETVLRGISGYELTCRLRELLPRDTIVTTDVGSVKMITSQAWRTFEPLTFFESNGLSAMSYGLPAAMAARLAFPDRPVLCTIRDGGFGMVIADLETCVRERLPLLIVVFNDASLSLIDAAQQRRGYPTAGVRHGDVDFAAAAIAFGAWGRRVRTMGELDAAVRDALAENRTAVIDAMVDPAETLKQNA
jgi:acetolactate synthase I/II/III large subunit